MIAHMLVSMIGIVAATRPTEGATPPTGLDLSTVRAIPFQHDGRWPPLDTVARDLVNTVTGTEFFDGHDPVLVLLAWTFDPPTWRPQPVISIRNAELRRELQLSDARTVFSFAELTSHRPLRALVDAVQRVPEGQKLDPLQTKVADIHAKLLTLRSVFSGAALKPIPNATDPLAAWSTIDSPDAAESGTSAEVSAAWSDLRAAYVGGDVAAFSGASRRLAAALSALPAALRPDPSLVATELRYNRARPFRTAWRIMVVAALLSAAALGVRRRWFDAIALVAMIAGFATLSYGLAMRWQIAGRIPASNMFESLLFLSWGMGAIAILSMFVLPQRTIPLTASGMGAVALVLADCLPMNHFIRPIAPVLLDTVWMSIHVPIIMVSYSVLALGVLVAHVQLLGMAMFPRRRAMAESIDAVHYWYVHVGSILLLAGIATGSMWAASSWGRYWGWDPKEVWSLVALLGYLTILHVRIDRERIPRWAYVVGALLAIALFALVAPKLAPLTGGKLLALGGAGVGMVVFVLAQGMFATALKSILAFWLIIMTYVGVNYVLGIGLHSYGFGTGAVVRHMFLTGGIDLGIVVLLTAVYVARREERASSMLSRIDVAPA